MPPDPATLYAADLEAMQHAADHLRLHADDIDQAAARLVAAAPTVESWVGPSGESFRRLLPACGDRTRELVEALRRFALSIDHARQQYERVEDTNRIDGTR